MKHVKKSISVLLAGTACLQSFSQNVLLPETNMFCDGDKIVKEQIRYKDLIAGGENVLWDVRDMEIVNKDYIVKYSDVADCKNRIAGTEHSTRYYYDVCGDTVLIGGFENNSTKITYDAKEIFLRFPMKYGDSYSGVFDGYGTCYDRIAVRNFGRYRVEADATGALLLPDGDTLRNVTRLHTERFIAGMRYPSDSLKSISERPLNADIINSYIDSNRFIMKKDIYRWYAPGYRYPVMETDIIHINGYEDKPYTASFYYPISMQDLCNDYKINEIPGICTSPKQPAADIKSAGLSYNIYRNGQESMRIEYCLSAPAELSYGIYTSDGKSVYSTKKAKIHAGIHYADIDMSGYKDGVYILRIDTGIDNYTEKIIIKR